MKVFEELGKVVSERLGNPVKGRRQAIGTKHIFLLKITK